MSENERSPKPGMSRPMRLLLKGMVLLIACLLLLINLEHLRGSRALDRLKAQLKSNGETLNVEDLLPPRPPPNQNAAPKLISAAKTLQQIESTAGRPSTPTPMKLTGPGTATISWQFQEWEAYDLNTSTEVTNTWKDIEQRLAQAAPALEQIRIALERPKFDSGLQYQRGFAAINMPMVMTPIAIRRSEKWLGANTAFQLRQGNRQAAMDELIVLLSLTKKLENEQTVLFQLVRQAVSHRALALVWETLQMSGWSDEDLLRLQEACRQIELIKALNQSLEMERAMTVATFDLMRKSEQVRLDALRSFGDVMADVGGPNGQSPNLAFRFKTGLWTIAWSQEDERLSLERWNSIIDASRLASSNSWAALQEISGDISNPFESFGGIMALLTSENEEMNFLDKHRYLVSANVFGVSESQIRQTFEHESWIHMTIAAIALERFRLANDRYPEKLEDLVPRFLDVVPTDRMDGQPLKYRRLDLSKFLLYSSGRNGIDDGGKFGEEPADSMWEGLDALWPKPAPPNSVPAEEQALPDSIDC